MKTWLIAVAVVAAFGLGVGCGAGLSASALSQFDQSEENCVTASSTKDAADVCRAEVRATFCAAFPGMDPRCEAGAEGGDQ